MIEFFRKCGVVIYNLIMYSFTGYEVVDDLILASFVGVQYAALFAVLVFLVINPRVRSRKRPEDRFLFYEFILLLIMLAVSLWWTPFWRLIRPSEAVWGILNIIEEEIKDISYVLTILLWMMYADYSLYRSEERIRRKYKLVFLPVAVIALVVIIRNLLPVISDAYYIHSGYLTELIRMLKFIISLGCVLTAGRMVLAYEKEFRQPRFLRISIYVVPLILSNLFRIYDYVLITLGILLTYFAIVKRDRYLDMETGFYKRSFLDYISKYRDQKKYTGGNGILIRAQGHGREMADLLKELKPADSNLFVLDTDLFLLLSESLRGSAVKMAVSTIREFAESSEEPYTPHIVTVACEKGESSAEFAERLIRIGNGEDAGSKEVAL